MAEKDELPEEIQKKLLEKQAEAEESGDLDEIDLDEVTGGAYLSVNVTDPAAPRRGPRLDPRLLDRD